MKPRHLLTRPLVSVAIALLFVLSTVSAAGATPAASPVRRAPGVVTVADLWRAVYSPKLRCIRRHESDRNGAPLYLGGAKAKNRRSTASGFYQFLDGTWHTAAIEAGFPQWANGPARNAPDGDQHIVALRWVERHGTKAWAGSGC